MSNFRFLSTEWQEIGEAATKAESLAHADPRTSCLYARRSLELAVEWLYDHDSSFKPPYERNLSAMLHEPSFRDQLPPELFPKTRIIKDLGNQAAHSKKPIRQFDAVSGGMKLDDFWRFEIPKTAVRFLPKINEKPSSFFHSS